MLEENAQVVATEADQVWVETVRESACASCSAAKGCGQKLLSELGQGDRFRVLVSNPQGIALTPGDRVVLGIAESSLLTASVLVYLVPLLVMLVAALAVAGLGVGEPGTALAGVAGLLLGLGVVRKWGPRDDARCRFKPQVLRRIA